MVYFRKAVILSFHGYHDVIRRPAVCTACPLAEGPSGWEGGHGVGTFPRSRPPGDRERHAPERGRGPRGAPVTRTFTACWGSVYVHTVMCRRRVRVNTEEGLTAKQLLGASACPQLASTSSPSYVSSVVDSDFFLLFSFFKD